MVKNLPAKGEDGFLVPGLGRYPGEGNGNPLQYSCLGNPMDREAWQTIYRLLDDKESNMMEHACTYAH